MSENNKRKCPSIKSGMLDKLNNFVQPRTSLGSNLGFAEMEELHKIVNVRRLHTIRDFVRFNPQNMGNEYGD